MPLFLDAINALLGPRIACALPGFRFRQTTLLAAPTVARQAASIREIGLQTPLTVRARRHGADTRFILVAGGHRLEALRQLGEPMADCQVLPDDDDLAELWEINENFARAELTDAQRAEHHVRREAFLVRRGEVLKGPGQPRKNSDKLSGYSVKAAGDLGLNRRTVERDLARGKKIAPDVLASVAGTDLDKGVVLDELARTPRQEPGDAPGKIRSGERRTSSTARASTDYVRSVSVRRMRCVPSYAERAALLDRVAPPRDSWQARSCGDLAATLRALGVPPPAFRRLLDHLATWPAELHPAALCDLCQGFRVGAAPIEDAARFSGRPIGVCGRFAVLVWPKRESEMGVRR